MVCATCKARIERPGSSHQANVRMHTAVVLERRTWRVDARHSPGPGDARQ
jgi:hypothetical protein